MGRESRVVRKVWAKEVSAMMMVRGRRRGLERSVEGDEFEMKGLYQDG